MDMAENKQNTALTNSKDLNQFQSMPMGLKNVPVTMQWIMELMWRSCHAMSTSKFHVALDNVVLIWDHMISQNRRWSCGL